MRTARVSIHEAVKLGLAPMLKANGFKKTALNFARRRGTVAHYLNVQLSSWNRGAEGNFYLNAGLMFDEVCRHFGKEPPQLPKYGDCNFMVRMERLNPELPQWFSVNERTDLNELATRLALQVERTFVAPLAQVRSLESFAATGWVNAVPWGFPALFHFLTGNVQEARRLVQLEADTFADRGVTVQSVADNLGLKFAAGLQGPDR